MSLMRGRTSWRSCLTTRKEVASGSALRRMPAHLAALCLLGLLGGCAFVMSGAETELCDQALKYCNPTEPDYDQCVNRAGCGVR